MVLPLGGDRAFVGHAIHGRPLVCDGAVGRLLQALTEPQTLLELERTLERDELFADSPGSVVAITADLRARGILITSDPEQEIERARQWVVETHDSGSDGLVREQMRAEAAPAERWAERPPDERRRAVVLGWCTAEALAPALSEEARSRGVALEVFTGFENDPELARRHDADLTVLALGNFRLLAPLYASDSADAVAHALADCERLIRAAAENTRGTLLVQGCVAPQVEPLGLLGALAESSAFDRICELNRGIRQLVRALPSALYLDVERLFSRSGKSHLLDDLVAPWAHAGAAGGASNRDFYRILARACLDAFDAARGAGQIRCVALDLDGVLWPGEIADPEFSFDDEARATSLLYGVHGGIHEALRALRSRGLLLAIVSKNARASVLEKWNTATSLALGSPSPFLYPDDFVALKIGWGNKSLAIGELSRELGIALSAIAFLDDSPLERAEVRHAAPEVWVLDVPVDSMRETLLTSPRLELLERSTEARNRAEATRARVLRDQASDIAKDRAAFLDSLDVRCVLRDQHEPHELDRAAELIVRTNQFRTTAERISRRDLELLARDPNGSLTTMAVSDRFGSYGVVGVALTQGRELRLLVLSCRVIGADVHQVLFRAALEKCRASAVGVGVLVRFSDTPHNAPARRLFDEAQWVRHAAGHELPASAALPRAATHCQVTRC